MSTFGVPLGVLLLTLAMPAQDREVVPPPPWSASETIARLESSDAQEVAWAGHLVQRYTGLPKVVG